MASKGQTHQVRRDSRRTAAWIVILIIAVFRSTTLYAQTPALRMAAMVAAKADAAPAEVESQALRVLVGRSTIVETGSSIARVSLTSADIADALVTAPSQLLVNGKMPGTISMFVWDRGGAVRRYEVIVQRDLSRLTEQVKKLFPGEAIEVQSNGRNIVVSGLVSSKDIIEKAVNVAAGYVEKKEEIVSLLQISETGASNQVLLRVRFAEVSRTAVTELGASYATSPTGIKNNIVRATTQQFAAPAFSDMGWTKEQTGINNKFGSDVTSSTGKITFSDFLNFFLFNEKYDIGVMIKALQTRGLFQTLAEPNLVAESGKEASFLAGGEFPIPIAQGSGGAVSISVVFKEFGIRLNFTPVVTGNRVHLKVRPEVSALDFSNAVVLNGFRIPALTTRRTETEIELLDGQTFAVAGLLNSSMNSTLQKIPGIGDIPILGKLFQSKQAQKDRTELVVIITPHILPRNSTGVTSELPRMPESFLAPVPENRSVPVPPPAFTRPPGSVNDTTVAPAPAARKGSDGKALDPAAAAAAVTALTPNKRTVVSGDATPKASGGRPLTSDEKKAMERAHKLEEAAKAAEATQMTKQFLEDRRKQVAEQERQAVLSREQGKRDAEAARRAGEQAKRQAEIDQKRQKVIAEAEARLKEAEARYKADVAQKDKP
jgi:pilus assembly protein CpaC